MEKKQAIKLTENMTIFFEFNGAHINGVSFAVILRQSMTRTRNKMEKLRN